MFYIDWDFFLGPMSMDLPSVLAALSSQGVPSVTGTNIQVASLEGCYPSLAHPEPSSTFIHPGQHLHTQCIITCRSMIPHSSSYPSACVKLSRTPVFSESSNKMLKTAHLSIGLASVVDRVFQRNLGKTLSLSQILFCHPQVYLCLFASPPLWLTLRKSNLKQIMQSSITWRSMILPFSSYLNA